MNLEQVAQILTQIRYAVDVKDVEGLSLVVRILIAHTCHRAIEGLLYADFNEGEVARICGENYLRVLREVLPA